MPTVSLSTVRTTIRQRCDLVNSNVVTDAELTAWINDSGGEFNDLLTTAFGAKYNLKRSSSWVLTPGTDTYVIASSPISVTDFKALQRLEMQISGRWVKVPEAKLSELDRYQDPALSVVGAPLLAYLFLGNSFLFAPVPQQALTLRMYYTRAWVPLVADGDTFETVDAWHELIVLDGCIKAMAKQDLPADVFMAQKLAMVRRIEDLKQQRNAADPPRITDVTGNTDERPTRWGYR